MNPNDYAAPGSSGMRQFSTCPPATETTNLLGDLHFDEGEDDDDVGSELIQRLLDEVSRANPDDDTPTSGAGHYDVPSFSVSAPPDEREMSSYSAGGGAAVPHAHFPTASFMVEAAASTSQADSSVGGNYRMPTHSPFNCYSGIPNTAKMAPPTFAEAVAHSTPVSLTGQVSPVLEGGLSPLAHYVPNMPTVPVEVILLRNCHGVFLLQPMHGGAKPTPPYTPPMGGSSVSPPVSPLPLYALPPAAGSVAAASAGNFLGAPMMQAGYRMTRSGSQPTLEPPQYSAVASSTGGNSPFMYAQSIPSMRGTPSLSTAPPPYGGGGM